jgi:hypothetical protein
MFEPEALGFTSAQYQQVAVSLVTPVLGFLFLFMLGLPLKKIPFIDAIEDYSPPVWVLPLFALGSLFICSLFLSIALFLNSFRSYPDQEKFLSSFIKTRKFEIPADAGALKEAVLTLNDYDGLSNFRVIINGYRMFGSSSDCLLSYQCKPPDPAAMNDFNAVQKKTIKDGSIHHLHYLNLLPAQVDVTDHFVQAENFIDIVSENSGLGDCRLSATVSLIFLEITLNYTVNIFPQTGDEKIERSGGDILNTFFASGRKIAGDDESEFIEAYGTRRSEATNRLCERLRLQVDLSKNKTAGDTR